MTAKKEKTEKVSNYFEAVGRRKTAIARVRVFTKGEKGVEVNGKKLNEYFPMKNLAIVAEEPLKTMKISDFRVTVKLSGGGVNSQAEAVRLGIARALVKFNAEFRKKLKKMKLLTRDSRAKERRKFGLKKARKAGQWSKR